MSPKCPSLLKNLYGTQFSAQIVIPDMYIQAPKYLVRSAGPGPFTGSKNWYQTLYLQIYFDNKYTQWYSTPALSVDRCVCYTCVY